MDQASAATPESVVASTGPTPSNTAPATARADGIFSDGVEEVPLRDSSGVDDEVDRLESVAPGGSLLARGDGGGVSGGSSVGDPGGDVMSVSFVSHPGGACNPGGCGSGGGGSALSSSDVDGEYDGDGP